MTHRSVEWVRLGVDNQLERVVADVAEGVEGGTIKISFEALDRLMTEAGYKR